MIYVDEHKENGTIPSGQSVKVIDALMSANDIYSGFTKKAEEFLKKAISKI